MQEHTLSPVGRFERIILATDGSRYSEGAIRVAQDMARKCDARLIVMSIGIVDPAYSTLVPNLEREAEAMAQRNIDAAKSAMEGLEVQEAIRLGSDPAEVIVATAEELRADVIVMGRHGRRGLARWKLGHATAKVVGHAPCPVLVVPSAARMWEKRVLVATDGSRYGELAAVTAGKLAQACGLPLTAVSAVLPSHGPERRQSAQEAINEVVEDMGRAGVSVNGHLADGRPDKAILESAGRDGADLIVMGSHGRTGMNKMLMGSVSEKVLNQADCAVLVVKA
ncbi:MAG: universal stress protein [Pseudomonadota bacterium]